MFGMMRTFIIYICLLVFGCTQNLDQTEYLKSRIEENVRHHINHPAAHYILCEIGFPGTDRNILFKVSEDNHLKLSIPLNIALDKNEFWDPLLKKKDKKSKKPFIVKKEKDPEHVKQIINNLHNSGLKPVRDVYDIISNDTVVGEIEILTVDKIFTIEEASRLSAVMFSELFSYNMTKDGIGVGIKQFPNTFNLND